MRKGTDTRRMILEAALDMASRVGFEAISIGQLAAETGMSKSGLFAHFQSKENLQLAALELAGEQFAHGVVIPALREPAGIARIRALVANWITWTGRLTGGCIFVSASNEYKDQPGRVRDLLMQQQAAWIDSLERIGRAAIAAGDFRQDADVSQFAFELYSLLLGFHLYYKILEDDQIQQRQENALTRLLADYKPLPTSP